MPHLCESPIARDIEERLLRARMRLYRAEQRDRCGRTFEDDHAEEKLYEMQELLGCIIHDVAELRAKPMHRRFEVEQ